MKWGRPRLPASPRSPRDSRGSTRFGLVQSFGLTILLTVILVVFLLYRQKTWQFSGQRAVVIIQEEKDSVRRPITIAVVDPSASKLTLIPLPRQQYVSPSITSYGPYQTDALVGLTQLDSLKWEFLQQTLAWEYGVGVDGILWTNKESVATLKDVRSIAQSGILNTTATTMKYWDRWQWQQMLSRVPEYQVETAPLAEWLEEDGTLKELSYDGWAERTIQDTQVRQSAISVVVQNGSGVQGQANRVARALRLTGFGVRNIDTVGEQSNTKIVLSPSLKKDEASIRWSIARIHSLFPYADVISEAEITERTRADIVVILGKDQAEELTLRRRQ